ncbi:MAG: tyrosine-type recombinase/integrase, partial [Spirochaetaceae bacterium]|nr:tyrosine-type recombinase/integrase [Spirochaetaceae bacterium]
TREEVRAVVQNAGQNRAFVLLLALTGMRFSELYGVTENDIVQIDGVDFVYLQQQKDKDGEYIPLKTKTARYIPLSPRLLPFVRSMNVTHSQACIRLCLQKVFASLENAKARKLSCHSFRHFFITDAKAQNINPQKVEVIAGHTLSGIEKTYTNFKPSDLIDIIVWQNEMLDYLNSAI